MKIKQIISLILCLSMILSFVSCAAKGAFPLQPPSADYWEDIPEDDRSSTDVWENDDKPNINITVIGGDKDLTDKEQGLVDAAQDNISVNAMIYNAVQADLNAVGFNSSIGYAFSNQDLNQTVPGIYYYTDEFDVRASNTLTSCGFVEVLPENIESQRFPADDNVYVVDPTSANEKTFIYDYDYQNIGPFHLIYKDKYIIYYTESDGIVRYDVKDNNKSNYDLSLGSLYNYDTDTYIYDESIYGDYQKHSGESLLGKENYEALECELKDQVEQQKKAGYNVEEYHIVYISPEAIQAYIDSNEEETFFGYKVDELIGEFGLGTALVYTEEGFQTSQIITPEDTDYNWKSFLIKCGIGCGIIIVGAVITTVATPATFSCALITITQRAVSTAISTAVGTLAIETVTGVIQGKGVEDSLKNATHKGLDTFANTFMIAAAVSSVSAARGKLQPKACFVAGTPVIMGNGESKRIEDIQVGDDVLSYNMSDWQISIQRVTDIFSKEVYQTIVLTIGDEYIETTYNHPFYSSLNGWVEAGKIKQGDCVLNDQGDWVPVQEVTVNYYTHPVTVYNFTVETTHTYFVGTPKILVHNSCQKLLDREVDNARSKAARAAKKEALSDLQGFRDPATGKIRATDLREWAAKWGLDMTDPNDSKIANFVAKNNRFPSFRAGDGIQCDFAHGVDVNKIVKSFNEGFISKEQASSMMSNSNNGILTSRANHYLYHSGKWSNTTNLQMIVKARPAVASYLKMIVQGLSA